MLLWVPALAASTGLRLHPRSPPARAGLRLRQVERVGRSAAAVADPEGVMLACSVTGKGGGSPPAAAALLLDRRARVAPDGGHMRGTSAKLRGEDEERTLLVALPTLPTLPPTVWPPLPPLPSLVSLRLLRLLELLYPERGLTLLMEARPSRRFVGLGLPGSDCGDVGVLNQARSRCERNRRG